MLKKITILTLLFVSTLFGQFRGLGFIPKSFPESMVKQQLPPSYRTADLPAQFDWRNVDGINYITSVKVQGSCGSCWAFAGVAQFESAIRIHSNYPLLPLDFSEQELVSCHPDYAGCEGGNFPIDYFEQIGITDEDCFPYDTNQTIANYLHCENICSDAYARRDYRLEVDIVNTNFNVENIKQAVYHCPMFLGINALRSLAELGPTDEDSVWIPDTTDPTETSVGGHAMLCVGWNDNQQCLIFKNSWGTQHGDSGFVKISYRCFDLDFPKHIWLYPDTYDTYIFPVQKIEAKLVKNWDYEDITVKSETTYLSISAEDTIEIISPKFFQQNSEWYMVESWSWMKDLIDTTLFENGNGNTLSVVFDAPMEITFFCSGTTAVATEPLSNDNIVAYPNPFTINAQKITISFYLSESGIVNVKIFDVGYNLVNSLIIGEEYNIGSVNVLWDGKNQNDEFVEPGVYFVVIESTSGEKGITKIVARKQW
ncbi:hypothetical protein DRQ33_06315 [bacterium]|nr:MAG: hypothetical protein DRQ33_06315 [bacterium]